MQNFGDLLESDHLRRPEGDWEYDTEVDNSNTGFLEVKIQNRVQCGAKIVTCPFAVDSLPIELCGPRYDDPWSEFLGKMRGSSCDYVHFGCCCGGDGCLFYYLLAVVAVPVTFVFVTLNRIMTCVQSVWSI